ncbi:histidine kinase N-terminal 7TM domain-containing diguanylate cyclase [Demequina lutea]|uniref:Diguanylate cyclase (GGDEF)-like protein n=1 Tax=Demequina lutea TaxID=431489 RepID=A0A7Y9ZCC3_9MICO|nr:diguanylate cyclase [Demequina lutea]NYI40751.1 diguanylate cyclase (GGDEF)-like protein [Demequina lutea]
MHEAVLLWVYGTSALIAVVVIFATVRAPGLSSLRVGLLIYLTGTAWWATVDLLRVIIGPSSVQAIEAWTMPALALVVAGIRAGIHGATHPGRKLSAPDVVGFAAHPALTVIAASLPMLWGLVAVKGEDGSVAYGPLFWANVAITYSLFTIATIEMFKGRHDSSIFTGRNAPLIASFWAIPIVASVVTVVISSPAGIDLTAPAFALTSLLIWRAVVPLEMRQAVRIARSQVLEELADAVIVLGNQGHILDANAAALRVVGAQGPASAYIDKPLRQVWPCIADAVMHPGEHDLTVAGADVVLDVTISPLSEANGAPSGRAVVLRDVTDAVLQRRELAHLRTELADLVVRDAVTGLHNRRYAEQTLPQSLARCVAKRVPMSIAVIDVDHFKAVNDTYGHPVGDRVLRELASAMLEEVPSSTLARIGGEEFLILLPGLTSEQAFAHTEGLRDACARASVSTREGALHVTVSAGVATTGDGARSVAVLMDAADAALYHAKREGRDRTCVAQPGFVAVGGA